MKKCSYCGRAYPDDATTCAIDGEALPGLTPERKKVTGVWRGTYGYGKRDTLAGMKPVRFTLKLKQGWLSHFTGSVTEDAPQGIPGTGIIDGYFGAPTIEFTKQMPVGYVSQPDGGRITLREHILAQGQKCEDELPSSPIFYLGNFIDANRVQGTWLIRPQQITLPGGGAFSVAQRSGFWCAEFTTVDARLDPTGGPTDPLFDKTLLSSVELEQVDGVNYRSLGQFTVGDAERLLERFGQEDVRVQLARDDSTIRQMMPIDEVTGGHSGTGKQVEIFVHPDDAEKAAEIIGQGSRI